MTGRDVLIKFSFSVIILLSAVAQHAFAQKTLFDVPSLDIVERKRFLFQEQATFTSDGVNTTTAFSYGVGDDLEVGVTIYQLVFQKAKGLEVDPSQPDDNPDFLLNAQKGFEIREWVTLGWEREAASTPHEDDRIFIL